MQPPSAEIEQGTKGWWMPAGHGDRGHKYANKQPALEHFLDDVGRAGYAKRVAVQAGGHVGVYPRRIAQDYGEVVTFEPHPGNFRALAANVDAPNVHAICAALAEGNELGGYALSVNGRNSGGHHIRAPDKEDSPLLSLALDSISFDALDALILDCEGAEYKAVMGALDTIRRHRPVILIEQRGHVEGKVGGATDADVTAILQRIGYTAGQTYHHDRVFWP